MTLCDVSSGALRAGGNFMEKESCSWMLRPAFWKLSLQFAPFQLVEPMSHSCSMKKTGNPMRSGVWMSGINGGF